MEKIIVLQYQLGLLASSPKMRQFNKLTKIVMFFMLQAHFPRFSVLVFLQ
jgi:hypothetical protein